MSTTRASTGWASPLLQRSGPCALHAAERLSLPYLALPKVLGDGMAVVKKIYNCGEKPNQGQIQNEGNAYLDKNFPELSKIVKATIVTAKEEI